MDEAKNFTAGQPKTLSKTIVACKVKFRAASFFSLRWQFILDAFAKSLGTRLLGVGEGAIPWQNHCLTERPASHIKGFLRDAPYLTSRRWGSQHEPYSP